MIDSRDVAAAHVAALTRGQTGETYILGAHNVRLSELFAQIEIASGVRAPKIKLGYRTALAITAARCAKSAFLRTHPGVTVSGLRTVCYPWFFNSEKAQRELGLAARALGDTVRCAVEWHLNNPNF